MPTIKNRRATTAQWTLLDPVLAAGEIGLEIGTNKLKIGNGLSAWSKLSYVVDETKWASLVSAAIANDETVIEAAADAVMDQVATLDLITGDDDRIADLLEDGLGYVVAFTDLGERVALGIKPDGTVYLAKVQLPPSSVARSNLASDVSLPEETNSATSVWSVEDLAGRGALWVTPEGHVSWSKVTDSAKAQLGIVAQRIGPEPTWSSKVSDWNPEKSLYNMSPTYLRNWSAAFARASAGLGTAHITTFVDSETYGAAVTGSSNPKWSNSWPGRLRRLLDLNTGYVSGTGIAVPWNTLWDYPPNDPRWVFGAGATQLAGPSSAAPHYGPLGRGAVRLTNDTGTGFLEFTAVGNVDRYTIFAIADPGATGLATVKIDDVSIGTFDVSTAGGGGTLPRNVSALPGVITVEVKNLTSATHKIRIEGPAASTVAIWGIEGGTGKGVRVSNLSRSSCSTAHLIMNEPVGNTYGMGLHIDTADADLSIMMLGLNDRPSTSTAFKDRVRTAVARVRAGGGDLLFVVPGQPNYNDAAVGATTLVSRAADMYQLSDELSIPLLDMAWVRKDFDTANALGMYGDGIHSNDLGLEHHARFILNAIIGV